MGLLRLAPISTPDQAVLARELAEQGIVALPRELAVHHFHEIACQSVVVHAHFAQLARALIEQLSLAFATAERFEEHQLHAERRSVADDLLYQVAEHRLEEQGLRYARGTA